MRINKYLSNKRGVSLMEVMAAVVVMGIALFAEGTTICSQFSFINQNREKTIATLAIQEEIEYIRGLPFSSILNLVLYPNSNPTAFTAPSFQYLNNAAGTVTITDVNNSLISGSNYTICKVSVDVSWTSITGNTLQKNLVALITSNGINKQ